MSNEQFPPPRPRVLFFGMQSRFSLPPLLALLEHGIEVSAIIMPSNPLPGMQPPILQSREALPAPHLARTMLPLIDASPSIIQCASTHHIPIWEVTRLNHNDVISLLTSYQPDLICVACFSLRIPRVILQLPRLGCLNVHPSLLPANRGPVPLFWTFHERNQSTGVTIHLLDEGMDTGDILAQEAFPVPDGISYEQLETYCARRGGALLVQTVENLSKGNITRTAQDETKSSYYSFPTDEYLIVHPQEWTARHLYNFIRGVGCWGEPIKISVDGSYLQVRDCISYSMEDENQERDSDGLVIHCQSGQVRVKVI